MQLNRVDGWPEDSMYSNYCVMDWKNGDNINPTIGPTLTLTGTLSEGNPTPWKDVLCTSFDSGEHLKTTTALDPGTGDIVLVGILSPKDSAVSYIFSTRDSTDTDIGWVIYTTNNRIAVNLRDHLGSQVTVNTLVGDHPVGSWILFIVVIDRNGDVSLYVNADPTPYTDTCVSGNFESTDGIGINCRLDGGLDLASEIGHLRAYYGDGIADLWTADYIAKFQRAALGMSSYGGDSTFTRSSVAAWDVDSKLYFASDEMPRLGSDETAYESTQTNKAYRNVDPADGTTWTVDDASSVLVIDDSTALAAAFVDISVAGPNVFRYNNSTGASRYMRQGAQTGNTNAHSLSVYARIVSGSGAEIGWWDVSATSWTKAGDITDGYVRTEIENLTPPDTDCVLCIHVPDGCELRWILQQNEEHLGCTTPIANWATAATATRAGDFLDTGYDPEDTAGSIVYDVAPLNWTFLPPITYHILACSANLVLQWSSTTTRFLDGTNNADASHTWSGSKEIVRVSWGDPGLYIRVGSDEGSASYDGSLNGTGNLYLGRPGFDYAWSPRRLMVFREYQEGGAPWAG
jgi:hypothetical protein